MAGDFYDFIIVDDEHVGILVADVSGHGLPAALIASMLKAALSAQCAHACSPARILAELNQSLCGKFKSHFATAAYLFVDMQKKSMSYAAAGHPPLLLWHTSTGSASEVLENGLPLGLLPEATYSVVDVPFAPGDKVLLYTDGVPETTSPADQEFGVDLLKGFLETNHGLTADTFADSLLDELASWSENLKGQGQQDDLTLLTIDFANL